LALTLFDVVRGILRRMQRLFVEQIELTDRVRGRVVTSLAARYMPSAIPVKVTSISLATPANLLLVSTVLEVEERLRRVIRELEGLNHSLVMSPVKEIAVRKLKGLIDLLSRILSDPMLKPLIQDSKRILGNSRKIKELEKVVKLEIRLRPREYSHYARLLELREGLSNGIGIIERFWCRGDGRRMLTLQIEGDKLYELFCFTMLLNSVISTLNGDVSVNVDDRGQIILIRNPKCEVRMAYNTIPSGVGSIMRTAKVYGLIDDSISPSRLGGLPDTIVLATRDGIRRRVVIDYKYTDDLSYIVQSRFKALAYLYEFDADVSIVIAKPPKVAQKIDEEVVELGDFYGKIADYGGARIVVNNRSDGKTLVIAYLTPRRESMNMNEKVVRSLVEMMIP